MSSILDAVTKDASRSGSIPGAAPAPPSGGSPGPSGPSRLRSAVLVVVVGVALGALAARQFGGGEPATDELLTEKVAKRAASQSEAVSIPPDAAQVAALPSPSAADQGSDKRSRKDEAAHQKVAARRKADSAGNAAAKAAARDASPKPGSEAAAADSIGTLVRGADAAAAAKSAPPTPAPLVIPAPPSIAQQPPHENTPAAVVAAVPAPAPDAAAPSSVPATLPASPAAPIPAPAETAPTGLIAAPSALVSAPQAPPPVAAARAVPATPPTATAPAAPAPGIEADADDVVAAPPVVIGGPAASPDAELQGAVEPAAGTEPAAENVVLDGPPAGAPEVSIMFVAWSRTPARRMVSLRVGQGALNVVHEGEYVEGVQISTIHPESVDLQWTGQRFRVPVRAF